MYKPILLAQSIYHSPKKLLLFNMQTEQQNGVCPKHISHLTSLQATIIAVAGWLLKRDSRKTAKFVLHLQAAVSANFATPHVPSPLSLSTIFLATFWCKACVWRLDFFLFNSILLGAAPTTCEGKK